MTARRRWRLSITAILGLGFGSLTALAVGGVLLIGLLGARANTGALLRDKAELTLDSVVDHIRGQLDPIMAMAEQVREHISLSDLDPKDQSTFDAFMFGALAAMPQLTGVGYVTPDFRVRRYGRSDFRVYPESIGDQPAARRAMEAARADPVPAWGEPLLSPLLNETALLLRAPIMRRGEFRGLLVPVISIRSLSVHVDEMSRESGLVVFVLDGGKRVLAHPVLAIGDYKPTPLQPVPDLDGFADPVLAAIWRASPEPLPWTAPLRRSNGHLTRLDGQSYVVVWREIAGYGPRPWIVGAYLPADRVGEELVRLRRMAAVGIGVLLGAVLLTLLVGRRIGQPILHPASAASSLRGLDFAAVPPVGRSRVREIDQAARAFDTMIAGLKWFEIYVPRALVRRLMARGGAERSDERQISVMFTDIVGFTNVASHLPAADCAELLNRHFALLGECIDATDGTIDKYVGDSVMAFWGAPLDQPDHAARAVEAARLIAAAIARDNARRRAAGEAPIRLRIGLHSGPAIVGNIGAPGRINYTIVGDTVNVAQRIEQVAKEVIEEAEVAVLLSEVTREALDPAIETRDLGQRPLRGRDEAIGVHMLVL